jgi:hypothetical protein
MVKRGGVIEDDKVRQHLREHYTSTIVLGLTHHIEKLMQALKQKGSQVNASYCVWAKEKALENQKGRLDPNYATKKQFKDCPFH